MLTATATEKKGEKEGGKRGRKKGTAVPSTYYAAIAAAHYSLPPLIPSPTLSPPISRTRLQSIPDLVAHQHAPSPAAPSSQRPGVSRADLRSRAGVGASCQPGL